MKHTPLWGSSPILQLSRAAVGGMETPNLLSTSWHLPFEFLESGRTPKSEKHRLWCWAGEPRFPRMVSSHEEEKEHSTNENPRVLAFAFFGGTTGSGSRQKPPSSYSSSINSKLPVLTGKVKKQPPPFFLILTSSFPFFLDKFLGWLIFPYLFFFVKICG